MVRKQQGPYTTSYFHGSMRSIGKMVKGNMPVSPCAGVKHDTHTLLKEFQTK